VADYCLDNMRGNASLDRSGYECMAKAVCSRVRSCSVAAFLYGGCDAGSFDSSLNASADITRALFAAGIASSDFGHHKASRVK
jgi:hypothetical protein